MTRARVMAAQGDAEGALAMLTFERMVIGRLRHPPLESMLVAERALLLDALGEHAEARDALRREHAERPTAEAAVALARLRAGRGRARRRARAAGRRRGPGGARSPTRVQAGGLRALAHDALLDHDAAGAALRRALGLAEPAGCAAG